MHSSIINVDGYDIDLSKIEMVSPLYGSDLSQYKIYFTSGNTHIIKDAKETDSKSNRDNFVKIWKFMTNQQH